MTPFKYVAIGPLVHVIKSRAYDPDPNLGGSVYGTWCLLYMSEREVLQRAATTPTCLWCVRKAT